MIMDIQQMIKKAKAVNRERRAAVLAHPDLAARLTKPPLSYSQPEHWNGYVPPEYWNGEHNDSPQRAALLDISAEAWNREHNQPITPDN